MYEQSFQLSSRPFTSTPFVKHYYPAESIQKSASSARLCIDRGSGPVIVIGETGTGKSLLLAMLEEQYRAQFSVINLACARLDQRQELLQSILYELQLPYRGMSEGELRLSLMDYLKPSQACPNGVLFLVDEAQNLSVELLDEIRLLTNYVRDGQPRVRLVMSGNQRLEEMLANPKLESFNHRIAARCYLTSLSQSETADYVVTHMDRAGGDGNQTFGQRSLRAVHELSDGCPRFINQICDHALILAATRGVNTINESMVREAWADVQNLPNSFTSPPVRNAPTAAIETSNEPVSSDDESWTVIEFGNLENEAPAHAESQTSIEDLESGENERTNNPFVDDEAGQNEPRTDAEFCAADFGGTEADASVEEPEPHVVESIGENHELDSLSNVGDPFESSDEYARSTELETEFATEEVTDEQREVVPEEQREEAESSPGEPRLDSAPEASTDTMQEAVDPFAEDFENEEEILDRYLPLVAAHNQSSLRMTKDELSFLHPQGDQSHEASRDDRNTESASESHDPVQDADSLEIAREADEILAALNLAQASEKGERNDDSEVSHGTDFSPDDNESDTFKMSEHTKSAAVSFVNDVDSNFETMAEEDDAERESLKGIIEEKNRVTAVTFGERETEADPHEQAAEQSDQMESSPVNVSDSLESPPPQSAGAFSVHEDFDDEELPEEVIDLNAFSEKATDSEDDQDILIINRPAENYSQPKADPPQIPFPATPVSTGQAKRMDYQQLFDQLRSTSND